MNPELQDPLHLSKETIEAMIQDPEGSNRIHAYMHTLAETVRDSMIDNFRQALHTVDLYGATFPATSVEEPNAEMSFSASKNVHDGVSEPEGISQSIDAYVPEKLEVPAKTWAPLDAVPVADITTYSPDISNTEKQYVNEGVQQPSNDMVKQVQMQQKEEEDSTVKTKSIDSKELEKRYQKRQESIQDIVKKKGNIS